MDPITTTAVLTAAATTAGAWHTLRRAQRAERHINALHAELHAERHAARHDPLTDLLNRRAFYQHGLATITDLTRHPLVAVVLDLDDFKKINDRYGHAAGDEVLTTIARRLATLTHGHLTARLGGDEFAALLSTPTTDSHHLHTIAANLNHLLSTPISLGSHAVTVTASIGLAAVRGPDIAHFAQALRDADHDMYHAKTASHTTPHRHTAVPPQHIAVRSSSPGRGSATRTHDRPFRTSDAQRR